MKPTNALLLTALLCGLSPLTFSQPYPSKAVVIIVPYAPGGITDVVGRQTAAALGERWKQSVLVDNRPGGGTIVGTAAAAKAAPDGYTLLLTSFGFTTNQILISDLPYDPAALAPVTLVGTAPNVLYVHPSVPARTPKEVIDYAKSRPKGILLASSGNASSPHIAAELFASLTGIEMTHVPYKGTGPAMIDVLGGRVHGIFDTMQSMPYAKSGKLRVIAVANSKRLSTAQDLPTFAEFGIPQLISASWFGFFVPARTPPEIQKKVYDDVRSILAPADMREKIVQAGLEPASMTREEFTAFLDSELKKWGHVIRTRNIKLEP
ncbi:MAG TPA: tripartite tricarboxylate transporter substrate binding protein [Burkholderiales bacterium]|nr:tripartite tricarboxylate transporter substrate binding protein [Burkholderiales bacterium]